MAVDEKCVEERYDEARDDFLTALNYTKVVDGHDELKDRFYAVRDEYYENILGVRIVRSVTDGPRNW